MEAGNFTFARRLGEGPLGVLYEGTHKQTGERVVIRVLNATLSREPNLLGRLQKLMRVLTQLESEAAGAASRPGGHDSALPLILECGFAADGSLYIANERAPGESLSVQLQRHAGLPLPNKALRLGRQLSAYLSLAHGLGIRHLGLRPSKVLLTTPAGGNDGEQIRLIELGLLEALGRALAPGELLPGQAAYLAPEQRRGESAGEPADVFALGVILYEMGSGGLPPVAMVDSGRESAASTGAAAQTGLLQLLPSWLQPFALILERMLAVNPADRPSMAQVSSTLQQLSSLAPGSVSMVAPASHATPKLPTVAVPGPLPGNRPRHAPLAPDRSAASIPPPSGGSLPRSGTSLPPPSGFSLPPPPPILAPLPSPSMATPKYGMMPMPVAPVSESTAGLRGAAPLGAAPAAGPPEVVTESPSARPLREPLPRPPEPTVAAPVPASPPGLAAAPLTSARTPIMGAPMAPPVPVAAAPTSARTPKMGTPVVVPPPVAVTAPLTSAQTPKMGMATAPINVEPPVRPAGEAAAAKPSTSAPLPQPLLALEPTQPLAVPPLVGAPTAQPIAGAAAALPVVTDAPAAPAAAMLALPAAPSAAPKLALPSAATPLQLPPHTAEPAANAPHAAADPTPTERVVAAAEAEPGPRGNRARRRARNAPGAEYQPMATSDSISDSPTIGPTPAAVTPPKTPSATPKAAPPKPPAASSPGEVIELDAEATASRPGRGASPSQPPLEMSADYTMSDVATGIHNPALAPTHVSGDELPVAQTGLAETGGTPIEPGLGGGVALRVGQLVGNFRVTSKIGQGGMGAVYAAVHRQIGRRAAVKVLHGPLAGTADYAARFLNEARAVNTVRHPGLVEIFDFGQLPDGNLYIIMEFLEGESLRAHERRNGPLTETKAKALSLQIAQALLAAHKNGIVHRDLKPENVMLVADPVQEGGDRVKVLDFGIAKVAGPTPEPQTDGGEFATAHGTTMGTPKYMAPEQYGDAAKVDGKADVFALGVMLYEMVSGQVPFAKTSLSAFAEAPKPLVEVQPNVSPQLAALVHRMLSAKADGRPTMSEVIPELLPPPTATGAQLTVAAPPPPPPRSVWPWVALLGVCLLGFIGVGAVLLRDRLWPTRPPSDIALENNDLQIDVNGPRARALGVLYDGLRSSDANLRVQAVRALGESRDSVQWSNLASLLKDPVPEVQIAAADALGVLGAPDAQATLLETLASNPGPGLKLAVGGALARMQNLRGNAVLRELLASGDDRLKLLAGLRLVETGDLSASTAVWSALQKQELPDDRLLSILAKLAQSGDERAKQQLRARMTDETLTLRKISAASNLARIGEGDALAVLGQAERTPGPQQLLASLMLAKVGDASGFPRLLRVAMDAKEPLPARQVAIDGVAACGRRQGALLLTRILDEKPVAPELRQSAAGAILQIAGGDPDQIAKQSLGWAQAALGHDSWLVRESATAVLGDLESDQSVPLLSKALSDPQQSVRRSAAMALGRKRLRAAVLALRASLNDAEPEVRLAGMRAIGRVIDAIGRSDAADAALSARLQELVETGSAEDQLVASGTLLQLGDETQRERLREGLNSPDALLRKLVVETVPSGDALLVDALTDPAPPVRFAAARRLAVQKVREAVPVLREALGQGGADSIVAYGLLKKMGETVTPPAGFGELLARRDLPTSLALLDVVADLPPADALPLLQKARFDSSPTLRRRVAEVAFALYKSAPSDASLSLLYSLLGDPDVSVRARAGALAALLTPKSEAPKAAAPTPDLGVEDQGAPPDQEALDAGEPPGAALGTLKILGEEKVRFQIGRRGYQWIAPGGSEVSVRVGTHRLKYVGGSQEVTITEGATTTVQIPATYADQLLVDAAEAINRREFVAAQKVIDRVRAMVQRGKAGRQTLMELGFQQGRVHEGTSRWLEAMTEFDRLLKMPEAQRKPEYVTAANAAVARLRVHLGRIEVTKREQDGRCLRIVQWVRPGEHVIDQGTGGQPGVGQPAGPQVIRLREGETRKFESCKGAPP